MTDKYDEIYCYDGTDVLINKQNIKSKNKLASYEKSIVAIKLMALNKEGITGNFDLEHFLSIHQFLFEDIYPFAGQLRRANISKDYFQFATWEYIEPELKRLLNDLKKENYLENIPKADLAKRLAFYWSEINVLHPFREGNRKNNSRIYKTTCFKK